MTEIKNENLAGQYSIKIKEGAAEKIKNFLNKRGYEVEDVVITDEGAWIHEADIVYTVNCVNGGSVSVSYGSLEIKYKNGDVVKTSACNEGGIFWTKWIFDESEAEKTDEGIENVFTFNESEFFIDDEKMGIKKEDLEDLRKLLAKVVKVNW